MFDHTEAYRRMLTIRVAEDLIAEDFVRHKIFSFYHSSKGQEAVAVGVAMALRKGDRVYGNHRSHGHYLACGGDLYRMFCEIYGKADGCCRGYGGSMHMLDRSVGFMGSTPLLGSVAPIALGSAFEQRSSGVDSITVCFVGDGASEEGVVYESLNIAALMKLPILFVIENNLFAVNSPESARRSRQFNRARVYTGLGLHYQEIHDGYNADSIHACTQDMLRTLEPSVLCVTTYREMAHSGPIKDESVRKVDTASIRSLCDPLKRVDEYLDPDTIAAIHETVCHTFDRAKDADDAK